MTTLTAPLTATQTTRRSFLTTSLAATAGLALGPAALARAWRRGGRAELILPWAELSPGVHAMIDANTGGNVAVVVSGNEALVIDSNPGLAAFYRTRQPATRSWLLPRFAATALAAGAAWTLGLLAAVYETVLLIGPLPVGQVCHIRVVRAGRFDAPALSCLRQTSSLRDRTQVSSRVILAANRPC